MASSSYFLQMQWSKSVYLIRGYTTKGGHSFCNCRGVSKFLHPRALPVVALAGFSLGSGHLHHQPVSAKVYLIASRRPAIQCMDGGAGVIVRQNRLMRIPSCRHKGCADLAQPNTVAPACTDEREVLRHTCMVRLGLHDEGGTIQVRRRQGTADFQLFPNDTGLALAYDAQTHQTP